MSALPSPPPTEEVRFPYAGGHFQAVAICPRAKNLYSFVKNLIVVRLREHPLRDRTIRAGASLRSFTTTDYVKLSTTPWSLWAMPLAFAAEADFSAMSPVAWKVQSVGRARPSPASRERDPRRGRHRHLHDA